MEQSMVRVPQCSSVISVLKWLKNQWLPPAAISSAGLVYISGCMFTPAIRSALSAKERLLKGTSLLSMGEGIQVQILRRRLQRMATHLAPRFHQGHMGIG
jgi:hypothetical protein